ncbi:MAG: hypothetical protein ACTICY_07365 [Pseudolactococcus laudensis]
MKDVLYYIREQIKYLPLIIRMSKYDTKNNYQNFMLGRISLQAPQAYHFKDAYELNQRAIQEGIVGTVADQAELNC